MLKLLIFIHDTRILYKQRISNEMEDEIMSKEKIVLAYSGGLDR